MVLLRVVRVPMFLSAHMAMRVSSEWDRARCHRSMTEFSMSVDVYIVTHK